MTIDISDAIARVRANMMMALEACRSGRFRLFEGDGSEGRDITEQHIALLESAIAKLDEATRLTGGQHGGGSRIEAGR